MNSPIADLSYRNYDGPLSAPGFRWWVVAKTMMGMAIKKRGFWVWATMGAYWYFILLVMFYFMDTLTGGQINLMKQVIWPDQFVNAFSLAQIVLFSLALLIGIGSISNDRRANALLVYLGKPCSKADYLFGKWVGICLPISIVAAVPAVLFYFYCLMSYRTYGVIGQDMFLLPKILLASFVPGFFHASLCLGISSLFDQGRLAGGAYAGIYFISNLITKAIQVAYIISEHPHGRHSVGTPNPSLANAYYFAVDGIQIGLAKIIFQSDGGQLIVGSPKGGNGAIPIPSIGFILPVYFGICAAAIWIAYVRVRPVEVIS
ncbi:MAG: ABC transporter permease subunit [Armatimonadetes bacterium]|nr:ABC transporter permease subunit [Armatimonadota bacterium]